MKRQFYLFLSAILLATATTYGQNAQQLYFNQLTTDFDYQARSFVVDTPPSPSGARAFLLWSKNFTKDLLVRGLSLDEFDKSGNFLSAQINMQPQSPTETIQPKKIIKAQRVKGYYLLGYVIRSFNTINGFQVYSTPLVIRLDDNLRPVWIFKIHYSTITSANAQSLIEYNDIIEASNGDLVLAGRYSDAAGQQSRVLLTRLNAGGAVLWAMQYFPGGCNVEAFSLTETTNRNLALTGYVEECGSTPSGVRRLLYANISSTGIPIVFEKLGNTPLALEGSKIVKHTNIAGADEFFITGYVDIVQPTGLTNRQVLLVDIKESGGLITLNHIGDAGSETGNDLTYRDAGNGNYDLYLTGATSSYYTNVKSEAFYLQLKYSGHVLGLAEFSTFPSLVSNYVARRGLEIKKAGKDRFAILANNDFVIGSQQRNFTHVFIRDLGDPTGNCIKLHQPPVTRFSMDVKTIALNFPRLPFTVYRDDFRPFEKVTPRLECGDFYVDAYNAASAARLMKGASLAVQPTVKGPVALKVFPNPVKDQLYIEHPSTFTKGMATARVYSTDMRLLRQISLPAGGNRSNISMDGLPAGLYFLQLQYGSETQLIKIKKD
ncbi:T9SS type A sorting domain-containing protein [Chitinophaga agrisoli]|uniref:T9SS type A sorting domain-containing protein n=1 Tax=Chitinophaga agrisoli TaxID=2607653 RepID=A0A5B2VIT1_9BACT|nr:T9SS type A sorting domain-containing protein [Chitinophaga agrisoli]KAA2238440.1 T9SS type A sorting domain-containing protein [Chitinophaga agrisoli]